MCDVYVTPYLNEAQMTSGTLAYSFGLGKAVVSTPYWHAKELLSDGRGILVPFGDAKAIGTEIAGLLTNDVRRHAMRKRAYAASRSMTWTRSARALSCGLRDCAVKARPGPSLPVDPIPTLRTATAHSGNSDRAFSLALRQYGIAPARGPFRTRPLPWLLCRRQRARAAVLERAFTFRRSAVVRDNHLALCGVHPARLEPGHPSVPKFHELRPPLAGRSRLGRQSWQDALGIGRMRSQGYRSISPQMGSGALQDRASIRRRILISEGLGLLAPGVGRLLHAGGRDVLANRIRGYWPTG